MQTVNTDLLRACARHHADGRPLDPHAHHRADHLATRRAARLQRWQACLAWFHRKALPLPAARAETSSDT